jgi:hypothetical protein
VLWGTTGVAAQVLRDIAGLHPVGVGSWRLAIAAAVLLCLTRGGAARPGGGRWRTAARRGRRAVSGSGAAVRR